MTAVLVGGWLVIPPLLSVHNYGQRIKRAQRLGCASPVKEQVLGLGHRTNDPVVADRARGTRRRGVELLRKDPLSDLEHNALD